MKNIALLPLVLPLIALAGSCGNKPETPKSAAEIQQTSDDDIFKFTITTDISDESEYEWQTVRRNKDEIKIRIEVISVEGQYPVRYDLDCEGDGDFEYKGLKRHKKCTYIINSGTHQIWARGEIPAMTFSRSISGTYRKSPMRKGCSETRNRLVIIRKAG